MRRETVTTKPKKLTEMMRDALNAVAANPDTALVYHWSNGWVLRRQLKKGGVDSWSRYEWVAHLKTLTVEALIRRGLLEVKVPRTTPGLYDVTAFLTDAGRAAATPSSVTP